MKTVAILATLCALAVAPLRAQEKEYMYEIGGGLGTSWGYGDSRPTGLISHAGLAADLVFRYNLNLRWALATDLSSQGVFDARYWQLGLRPELTFWNYGWGSDYREKHRVAPFLTSGFCMGVVSGTDDHSLACSVPVGLGMKWKMSPRWNAQLTMLFNKNFSDRIDGINDPYKTGTKSPVNTDWTASIVLGITFDFKERCIECHNQNSW